MFNLMSNFSGSHHSAHLFIFITYVNVFKKKRTKKSIYSQILCIFVPNKNLLKVNKRNLSLIN